MAQAQDEEKKEWVRDEFGQFSSDSDNYTGETRGARDGDTRAKDEFGHTITRQHQDAQKAVCALCFKKPGKNKARKINEDQRKEIVECGIDISRTCYHGKSSFIGNEARKLLKKVDQLEVRLYQALTGTDMLPLAQLYMKAFKEFDLVCFGQKLDPSYQTHIEEFMATYRSLGISVTLKLHVLERHTKEFLVEVGGEESGLGLGYFSEQSFESMHHETEEEEGRMPLLETHPQFGPDLEDLVVRMNGKRM